MRKVLILVVLVSLMVFVALPASAAILSWEDYLESYDSNSVTCVIYPDNAFITAWDRPRGSVIAEHSGSSLTYQFPANSQPCFQVWPMGASNKMRLSDIPNGTHLEYTITFNYGAKALHGNMITYIAYYDEDFNQVSATILEQGEQTLPKTFNVSTTMNFPAGASYFTVWCYLQGWDTISTSTAYGVVCSALRFTMDIEYLPDDSAILNGINDKLNGVNDRLDSVNDHLTDVDDQLGGVNDKLDGVSDQIDDMISGGAAGDQVTDQAGSVSDSVGQVDDFTSDIEAELNEGLANILDFTGLDSLASSFAFIGKYVDKIWYSMGDLHVVYFFAFGLGVFLLLTQHVPRVPSLKQQESQQEAHRNYVASLRRGHNPIDYSAHGNGQSHSYTVVQDSFFD